MTSVLSIAIIVSAIYFARIKYKKAKKEKEENGKNYNCTLYEILFGLSFVPAIFTIFAIISSPTNVTVMGGMLVTGFENTKLTLLFFLGGLTLTIPAFPICLIWQIYYLKITKGEKKNILKIVCIPLAFTILMIILLFIRPEKTQTIAEIVNISQEEVDKQAENDEILAEIKNKKYKFISDSNELYIIPNKTATIKTENEEYTISINNKYNTLEINNKQNNEHKVYMEKKENAQNPADTTSPKTSNPKQ